jgi:hypothetical protein
LVSLAPSIRPGASGAIELGFGKDRNSLPDLIGQAIWFMLDW